MARPSAAAGVRTLVGAAAIVLGILGLLGQSPIVLTLIAILSIGAGLLLSGATLLHVAAEFGNVDAARLLLDCGADVNARATVDDAGVGGQTAIFHAVTQFEDQGLPIVQLLVEQGADLSVRVKLPGHYERPDEVVECTPLGYARRFENEPPSGKGSTVAFLRERGAIE